MTTIELPHPDGTWHRVTLRGSGGPVAPIGPARSRTAFAAAHVVADPFSGDPNRPATQVDWDETLTFRHHLFVHGLGVAEAMDTAQRGMGLDWPTAAELIRRSAAEARSVGAAIVAGVATDQLPPVGSGPEPTVAQIRAAYAEQLELVEDAGAQPVLMASRHLARTARTADDYLEVYGWLIEQARGPVVLHWLGEAFDPALQGYWGSADHDTAAETVLGLIDDHARRIDGIKMSLLDAHREKDVRARLPEGVRLYTGDDINYVDLIRGDGTHHSDALLGVLAAIAPAAATALHALDRGDDAAYLAALEPTVPLARQVFSAPTYYYKVGIAFLAWLNGHQSGFSMLGGLQSQRGVIHLAQVLRLASDAGVLTDPDLAAHRMSLLLHLAGASR